MNIQLQRTIDRVAGKIICGLFSLLPQKQPASDFQPQEILIILLSEMGSLVLARPMLETIKEKYPEAQIHVLMFEKNREFLDILGIIPPENIYTVRGDSIVDLATDSLSFIKQARKVGIDTVIDCELFSRISSIYSFLSGATVRVGFERHTMEGLYRGSFINRPVLYNPYQHISQQFITMVEAISSSDTPKAKGIVEKVDSLPQMEFSDEEKLNFRKRLEEDFPGILEKKLVLIYPSGGLLPIRAWPLENYCSIASELVTRGYHVGIIGMKGDKAIAAEVMEACNKGGCYDLTGYTRSVHELMVLFQLGSLLISNDGGPGHFASLTLIPSILFYGPETPQLYGPLDPKAFIFYNSLSCSPCLAAYNHRNSACDGDNRCLKLITVAEVLEQAEKML